MRVKSEAKRSGIVDAAMAVFLEKGFEAASMSDIARRAGGSKATLYSYFASKEELYMEVMDVRCSACVERAYVNLQFDGDMRATLHAFGVSLIGTLLSPDLIAMRRVILRDAAHTEVGRLFYQRGPERGTQRLAVFLGEQMAAGRLKKADPMRAAMQLLSLMDGDILLRSMLGVIESVEPSELDAHVDDAVRVFLCAYGEAR